jgi:tetratricopeptide (TPR) repeat protein
MVDLEPRKPIESDANNNPQSILADIAFYLLTPDSAFAGSLTYQEEFDGQRGNSENRIPLRRKAMGKILSLVLDELSAYLEKQNVLKSFEFTPAQVRKIAERMLRKEIMEEKWDGHTYYLKARVLADPARYLGDHDDLKELENRLKHLDLARARARLAFEDLKRSEEEIGRAKTKFPFLRQMEESIRTGTLVGEELVEKGGLLSKERDYKGAIDAFSQAIDTDPGCRAAYNNRGAVYFFLEKARKALEDFDQVIALAPGNAAGYNNRASAYVKLGKWEEAITDYGRALELSPKYTHALYNRGVLYLRYLSDYQAAMNEFDALVESAPRDYRGYLNRGVCFAKLGRLEKAIAEYTRTLRVAPKEGVAYFNRGNAYLRMGKHEAAVVDYAKAIELNPRNIEAYYNRGIGNAQLGQMHEAISDFNRYIDMRPKDPKAFLYRGFLYLQTGGDEIAERDWAQAASLGDKTGFRYLSESKKAAARGL